MVEVSDATSGSALQGLSRNDTAEPSMVREKEAWRISTAWYVGNVARVWVKLSMDVNNVGEQRDVMY